jgi:hypothetical protein
MRYLYDRSRGAKRRVLHLTLFDQRTGESTMLPICGLARDFNTTVNVPFGKSVCKRCLVKAT